MIRKIFAPILARTWYLAILLVLLFCVPRFILVLSANYSGKYNPYIVVLFLSMWAAPWVFLSRHGREAIGLKRPKKSWFLPIAFIAGALCCYLCYSIFNLLYGHGVEHWTVYQSRFYQLPQTADREQMKLIFFFIYALSGMTLSPIGEEFVFRGIMFESIASKLSTLKASLWDSMAFAAVHLAHFGIIYYEGSWQILWIPALLWFIAMFTASLLFSWFRNLTDSIWGAVFSHAGFNFTMTYLIIYIIL